RGRRRRCGSLQPKALTFLGPFRHDRQWPRLSARALVTLAGAGTWQASERHRRSRGRGLEFWPQARALALTRRFLRHAARHCDGKRIIVPPAFGIAHCLAYVRDTHSLGSTALRLYCRARLPLGRDRVDRLATGLPAAARSGVVHDVAFADLSA